VAITRASRHPMHCFRDIVTRCNKHSAATNWNDLPYDIRDSGSVAFLSVNLRVIFLALPILPSHVSRAYEQHFMLYIMARYKFLYCIVLYES